MKFRIFSFCCIIAALYFGCFNGQEKRIEEIIDFRDTILTKQVISVNLKDTIEQYEKTYFVPTSISFDKSNFYYQSHCNPTCARQNTFYIYFERAKVISFCDSMLRALPPYEGKGDDFMFYKRISYVHIRQQAADNKMDNAIYHDELQILLERFSPFIVNPKTNEKLNYMIITEEIERLSENRTYSIRDKFGDTLFLAIKIIRPGELEETN